MGFAIAGFGLLRLIYWVWAFPNPDEAYYWWWGRNFSLSYYDHPPLFAWLQGLTSQVLPHSFWSLRFLNLITNGIFFYVYWWLVGYLYPTAQRQSWLWVVTAVCSAPLYFVMLTLAWHDHLLITLCLTASVLFLQYLDGYKFGNVLRERLLYGAVLLLSLAVITKYNALLFALGLGVAVWRRSLLETVNHLAQGDHGTGYFLSGVSARSAVECAVRFSFLSLLPDPQCERGHLADAPAGTRRFWGDFSADAVPV